MKVIVRGEDVKSGQEQGFAPENRSPGPSNVLYLKHPARQLNVL